MYAFLVMVYKWLKLIISPEAKEGCNFGEEILLVSFE